MIAKSSIEYTQYIYIYIFTYFLNIARTDYFAAAAFDVSISAHPLSVSVQSVINPFVLLLRPNFVTLRHLIFYIQLR